MNEDEFWAAIADMTMANPCSLIPYVSPESLAAVRAAAEPQPPVVRRIVQAEMYALTEAQKAARDRMREWMGEAAFAALRAEAEYLDAVASRWAELRLERGLPVIPLFPNAKASHPPLDTPDDHG